MPFFLVGLLDFFLAAALVLVFVLLDFLVEVEVFFLVAEDLLLVEVDFALVFFDLPGSARQCALVLTPFLFTEDLRQVQLLLAEQAELLKPEHWLAA